MKFNKIYNLINKRILINSYNYDYNLIDVPPSPREYPIGPIGCSSCLKDNNNNITLSNECIEQFGNDGCKPIMSSFNDPGFIFLYVLWGFTILYFIIWSIYRKYYKNKYAKFYEIKTNMNIINKKEKISKNISSTSTTSKISNENINEDLNKNINENPNNNINENLNKNIDINDEKDLLVDNNNNNINNVYVKLYESSLIELLSLFIIFFNFIILIIYVYFIVQIDYYMDCELKNYDSLCFYGTYFITGDYNQNSMVMFILWWILLFYSIILASLYNQIRNFIRYPATSIKKATHCYIFVEDDYEILSTRVNKLVKFKRNLENKFINYFNYKFGHDDTCILSYLSNNERYFIFEASRYKVISNNEQNNNNNNNNNNEYQIIKIISTLNNKTYEELFDYEKKIINDNQRNTFINNYGENKIDIEMPSIYASVKEEIAQPFYVYQLVMYSWWLWFSYLIVGVILCSVVIGSAILSIYVKRTSLRKILELAKNDFSINVKNEDNEFKEIDSKQLVIGDIVKIENDGEFIIPADLVLLQGDCAVDESGLTGESLPQPKFPLPRHENDLNKIFNAKNHIDKQHTLYTGCQVLEANNDDGECYGMVISTGISSSKGELISEILFPKKLTFKWDEEFFVAMGIMGIYAIIVFILAIILMVNNGANNSFVTYFTYGIYTISQTISPLLKVALVIGQVSASKRLSNKGIKCINPSRINIAGKIKVIVFDKTGTLTQDGLDMIGFIPYDVEKNDLLNIINNKSKGITNDDLIKQSSTNNINVDNINNNNKKNKNNNNNLTEKDIKLMKQRSNKSIRELDHKLNSIHERGLATCHSLQLYSNNRLLGNEVERTMFESTNWTLLNKNGKRIITNNIESIEVLRKFDFDHHLMLMSVIIKSLNTNEYEVFCKGAPEAVINHCINLNDDETKKILNIVKYNASNGCYVLALASKNITNNDDELIKNISLLNRNEIENEFNFEGIILFRNELKNDTFDAIMELKNDANIRPVICTGDNYYCGAYISKKSGITNKDKKIILGDLNNEKNNIIFYELSENINNNENDLLKFNNINDLLNYINNNNFKDDIEIGITGYAFNFLKNNNLINDDNLLFNIRIFARMKPEQKTELIKIFIENKDLVTAMTGDGGNDVGALRNAHVGLSLSEAESSIVSPFTSINKTIMSIVDLIKEGRCSLVTSFTSYKFLIIYGLTFSVLKLISFYFGVLMSNLSYLSIDLFAVISLSICITLTSPRKKLIKNRPTSSLLGITTVASIVGYFILSLIFLISGLTMMSNHEYYQRWPSKYSSGASWWTLADNWETTVIYISGFQFFITSGVVFSIDYHYRNNLNHNYSLIFSYLALYIISAVMLLGDVNNLSIAFHIASEDFNSINTTSPVWSECQKNNECEPSPAMPFEFRLSLFFLNLGCLILLCIYEGIFIIGPFSNYIRKTYPTKLSIKFKV